MKQNYSEISNIWNKVLIQLSNEIQDKHIYEVFFSKSYIHEISNNIMYLAVNTQVAAQLINTKYKELIEDIILNITQTNYKLVAINGADLETTKKKIDEESVFFKDSKIDSKFCFSNFVVGVSNGEAYQSALAVSSNLGNMYNPLFIYSDSGLGKTHLLHAIGNYVKENHPRKNILLISTDQFIDEYIRSARGEEDINALKAYLKKVDVLLIDDIQFLSDKKKTEEFFFPIFNYFVNNNKQIVLTCDRLPSELKGLEDRLVTRFSQGLSTYITKPEKETCISILKNKIIQNDLPISSFSDEAISFLAEKFSSSIRELEGSFLKLLNYTINFKPTDYVSLDVAIEAVGDLLSNSKVSNHLSERSILNTVCDYYNLTKAQIIGKSRLKQLTLARHIAMYLLREMLDLPFAKIGTLMGGKDHSTVMNGISNVEKMLKTNPQMCTVIDELKHKLA